jgi:6-phosphogluconolactonase
MQETLMTRREFGQSLAVAAVPGNERPLFAYVGTFSAPLKDVLPTQVDLPPGNGRGIHIFRVDRTTGALAPAGIYESGVSPSHLAINAAGTHLYSANETDRVGPEKHGSLSSFTIDQATGKLTLLNTVPSGGAGPTYVRLHPSGKYLFAANYFGGTVSACEVKADGTLAPPHSIIDAAVHGKIGPTRAKNAPPGSFAFSGHDRTHAHMIAPDPAGKFILHIDLGQDRIYVHSFENGKLQIHSWVDLPAGDGPRHFDFHPNGKYCYTIQEEGSTVAWFDWDAAGGKLTHRRTVSSLPAGYRGSNFCSEILVSADGRFLYAGNRLHDSIGIFSINTIGELTWVADEWTRGNYPRSFSFDPTGRTLYCCNQRADHVTVFRVDRETGKLAFTGQYEPVGNPSCVVFAAA